MTFCVRQYKKFMAKPVSKCTCLIIIYQSNYFNKLVIYITELKKKRNIFVELKDYDLVIHGEYGFFIIFMIFVD